MKIYTRNGDKGETGLLGAVKVSKSHLVVEVCGSVDETNSHLGCAIAHWREHVESTKADGIKPATSIALDPISVLTQIQMELFDLGSRVAAALASDPKTIPAELNEVNIQQLENWIDQFDATLPPLQTFILPSGSHTGCQLHLARTVCRRSERRLVELLEAGAERELSVDLVYLNRLSDLLFVMARFANHSVGCTETPWTASR